MNMSNRFEIETLARQREAEIEHSLQRSAWLAHERRVPLIARSKANLKVAGILAATVSLSALLAAGLSFSMAYALAAIR